MKKILIALDYSSAANRVAELGFELAEDMHANIVLVHILSDVTYYSSMNYSPITGFDNFNTMDIVQSSTREDLNDAATCFLKGFKEKFKKPDAELIIKEGDFADGILSATKESGADVIVLGTHSRRGLDKILMGSVAEKVLHKSDVPVYIIPVRNR